MIKSNGRSLDIDQQIIYFIKFLIFIVCFFSDRKNDQSSNGRRVFDGENHNLQEYTYKKITPCDVCSQVLRGKSAIVYILFQFFSMNKNRIQFKFQQILYVPHGTWE